MNCVVGDIELYPFTSFRFNRKQVRLVMLGLRRVYGLVVLGLRQTRLLISMLLILERLSWVVTSLLKENSLKYLVAQTFFILLALTTSIWGFWGVLLVVVFKLGLPPFHMWMMQVIRRLPTRRFIFFSTLHKVVPLFVLGTLITTSLAVLMGVVGLVGSLLIIRSTRRLYWVLISSAIINTRWMILRISHNRGLTFLYWGSYSCIVLTLIWLADPYLLLRSTKQGSSIQLFWLLGAGIPPFLIFWVKLQIIQTLLVGRKIIVWLILIIATLRILAYYLTLSLSKTRKGIEQALPLTWLVPLSCITL